MQLPLFQTINPTKVEKEQAYYNCLDPDASAVNVKNQEKDTANLNDDIAYKVDTHQINDDIAYEVDYNDLHLSRPTIDKVSVVNNYSTYIINICLSKLIV